MSRVAVLDGFQGRAVELGCFEYGADERADARAELLVRWEGRIRGGPQHDLRGGLLDDGVLELLLRAEVVEQESGGDAGLRGDELDRQLAVRVREQHLARSRENLRPPLVGAQSGRGGLAHPASLLSKWSTSTYC